jgi:hypothetical protein
MKIPRRGSVPTKVTKPTRVSVGVSAARTRRAARDLLSSDLSSKERPGCSSSSLVLAFGKLARFSIGNPRRPLLAQSLLSGLHPCSHRSDFLGFSFPSLPKMCVLSQSPRIESV